MKLSPEQTQELLTIHCNRVVNNMTIGELRSYAVQMAMSSFERNSGQGDIDVDMLIEDIWIEEDEDYDSTRKFIIDVVGNELAEEIMKTTQF